jgi:hypothetical protein
MISIKHVAECLGFPGTFSFRKDLFGSSSGTAPLSVSKQLQGLFCYKVNGVPDVDQRWSALPKNGQNYCVPATSMNWLYYLGVPPDPGHDTQTVKNLLALGQHMGIDPEEGTGFEERIDGLISWLNERNASACVIGVSVTVDEDCSIRFEDLRTLALGRGLVNVNVGRYKNEDGDFECESGHRLTMVGLHQVNERNGIIVHDPNNDKTNLAAQSETNEMTVPLANVLVKIEGTFVTVPLWGASSTTSTSFIDGYVVIVPMSLLTNNESGSVTYYEQGLKTRSVDSRTFALPFHGEIGDMAFHPGLPKAAIIGQRDRSVWMLDLSAGTWTRIVSLRAPRLLTFGGRAHHLFVLEDEEIVAINPENGSLRRVETKLRTDAISYDPKTNSIVAASMSSRKLLFFTPDLQSRREYELPGPPLRGPIFLTVGTRDGAVILTESQTNELRILRLQPSGLFTETKGRLAANRITAAAPVSRGGMLYTIEDGRIGVFNIDGNRVPAAVIAGLPGGTLLQVRRSHHNFDPRRAHLPQWRDTRIESLVDVGVPSA